MSRPWQDIRAEVESIMREFPCDWCEARRGHPCETSAGRVLVEAHSYRRKAAERAGRLPLAERVDKRDDARANRAITRVLVLIAPETQMAQPLHGERYFREGDIRAALEGP